MFSMECPDTARREALRLLGMGTVAVALGGCAGGRHISRAPYRYHFKFGRSAIVRRGWAMAPHKAPEKVHTMVAAGNRLQGKPYKWGGGHGRIEDNGYDCSGMVCYVLNHAGLMNGTTNSSGLKSFGEPGRGEWVTIYARDGHAFIVVADLRLDTGGGRRNATRGPRWTIASREAHGFHLRHPPGL